MAGGVDCAVLSVESDATHPEQFNITIVGRVYRLRVRWGTEPRD